MERASWQFFRLRPANFAPLRIAQGACWLAPDGLLHRDPLLILADAARQPKPLKHLRSCLVAQPSLFWNTHVHLAKPCKPRQPKLGRRRIDTLILNAVLPALLLHADQTQQPDLIDAVEAVLRALPPENDHITRLFTELDTKPKHALMAQGLHQLYRTRCTEGRCLSCAVGKHVLGM